MNTSGTVLVRELERMYRHVEEIDAAFDTLCVLFKRRSPLSIEIGPGSDVHDAHELEDNTVVLETNWLVSARGRFRKRLGDELAPWVMEHDDSRGVPCFRAAHRDVALAAESYEQALHLLGGDIVWLSVPDCLAETQGD